VGRKEQCEDVHNYKNMKLVFGLKLLPRDPRNLQLGKIVSLPAYDLTPDEFCLETLEIKNQKDTDFCASFSSSTASELQESVLLAPEFTFAAAKEISGDIQGFGLSFYDVLKAHIQVGAIEKKNSPFSVETKDRDFLADIKNWPLEMKLYAGFHRKKTYWEVSGQQTITNDIRSALWYFRNEKRAVLFGVQWGWDVKEIKINTIPESGIGHALLIIGYKHIDNELYFIVQNSYGKEAGYNGTHYFHWRVVEKFVKQFGAFMLLDLNKEEAEQYLSTGRQLGENWVWGIIRSLLAFIKDIFKK